MSVKKNKDLDGFSKLESMKTRVKKINKQIESLRYKLLKESEILFKEGCKRIFETHKDFQSFAWAQYTMYFNDGDPCRFTVYSDSMYINSEDNDQNLYELEEFYNQLKNKDSYIEQFEKEIKELEKTGEKNWKIGNNKEKIQALKDANFEEVEKRYKFMQDAVDLIECMDNESLERMFGDHAKVIVEKDKVSVESYEHD